ncbi:hypothetical protein QJQ45_011643 [Haematococcus lacustris]|nr:hypothetical protein QJQ45_011643 [Haematococcus lacustris]
MACGYGINAQSLELQAVNLDKGHVADLSKEANKHRRLLGMKQQGSLHDTLPLPCRMRHAVHVCRCLEQWQKPPTLPVPGQPKRGKRRGVGPRILTCPPPFTLTPMARVGLHFIKLDSQLVADKLARWKLTKCQVKHDSGLNNACRDTERWLALIKPHIQHLAAACSAGTSLVANLKHINLEEDMAEVSMQRHRRAKQLVVFFGAASIGTQGGWGSDAVLRACCKVVCMPRGIGQRQGRVVLVDEHRTSRVSSAVNGQQPCEEELDHEQPTRRADWKPQAGQVEQRLLRPAWSQQGDQPVRGMTWCPVVAPRKPPQPLCSSQMATQSAASELGPNTPSPAKRSKRTKAEQGKAAKAKPAPRPGRWLDSDCNAALNMQRIGESRWRPLELCWWPE